MAWAVVCGGYLLREIGRPLGTIELRSGPFTRLAAAAPGLRLPLPSAFLTAFDASFASERRDWNVVVLGRPYTSGVWYYFVLMWLLKTPVLLLAAEIAGLGRAAFQPALRRHPWIRLLAWNLVLTLAYFSLAFHAQIGYRYVLMAVPLAYVIAAAGLASLPPRPLWTAMGGAVVVTALAENIAYLGNPLRSRTCRAPSASPIGCSPIQHRLRPEAERLPGWLAEREWNAAPSIRPSPAGRNVIGLNTHRRLRLRAAPLGAQHRPGGHLGPALPLVPRGQRHVQPLPVRRAPAPPDPFAATVCPDSLEYALQPNGAKCGSCCAACRADGLGGHRGRAARPTWGFA